MELIQNEAYLWFSLRSHETVLLLLLISGRTIALCALCQESRSEVLKHKHLSVDSS